MESTRTAMAAMTATRMRTAMAMRPWTEPPWSPQTLTATTLVRLNRLISASVGIAQPTDRTKYGYLSEYDTFGKNERESGDYAEDIAAQMLASSLGIPFDIDKSWDEKRQQWTISGQIYKTKNITQAAKGNKDGKWTTVFAAAVLIV